MILSIHFFYNLEENNIEGERRLWIFSINRLIHWLINWWTHAVNLVWLACYSEEKTAVHLTTVGKNVFNK